MIGIIAPYGRNEVTGAALRLADLALALGYEVRLIAVDVHEANVNAFWDRRVILGEHNLYRSLLPCKQLVHFVCRRSLIRAADLVIPKAVHYLVPRWSDLSLLVPDLLARYRKIICPTQRCFHVVKSLHSMDRRTLDVTWCHWDSGLPALCREGKVGDGGLHAAMLCDSGVIDTCGAMALHLARCLLDDIPALQFTILSAKSWPRSLRRQLALLATVYAARCRLRKAGDFDQRLRELHQHDWLLLPTTRSDFGLSASRALACGTPVIANDMAPFDELIRTNHNGLLVPCERLVGAHQEPRILPSLSNWLEVARPALASSHTLLALQTRDWELSRQQRAFNTFWSKLWMQD